MAKWRRRLDLDGIFAEIIFAVVLFAWDKMGDIEKWMSV